MYPYVGLGAYYSEFHPHAFNGHENIFADNVVVQTGQSFNGFNPTYIFGQTCNTTGPLVYTWSQGFIGAGGDVFPPNATSPEAAKATCLATPSCLGITYRGDNSSQAALVYYKSTSAVEADPDWVSFTLPRVTGIDIVRNNSVHTLNGTIQECGVPLADWQGQSQYNDPGTTVGLFPTDEQLLEVCRRVIKIN